MSQETRRLLPDLDAVAQYGAGIAAQLREGDVVALSGDLGAGKTSLARAIIAALGYQGEVPSPTFTIIETYETPFMRLPIVHADFYRLKAPQEAAELGLDDYREGACLLAEWPECAGGFEEEAGCLSITLRRAGASDPDAAQQGVPESGLEGFAEGRIAIARGGADWLGRMV